MTRHTETIEVITRDQSRRRWSAAEMAALVRKTYEPGMSVSLVARQEGVAASLLFTWRKLDCDGTLVVGAGEAVLPGKAVYVGCRLFGTYTARRNLCEMQVLGVSLINLGPSAR